MPWLQLSLAIRPEQAEHYEEALLRAESSAITYRDQRDEPILEPALGETPLWTHTVITGLFDAAVNTKAVELLLLAQLGDGLPEPRWEIVEDKDWQREWMQHYQPIDCGNQLWICPSWLAPPDPSATNVLLDPGLAFGTGTHPTTLLCLQWLARQLLDGVTVIDYGCGSGILAIAALLRGAQHADAVDIDPQALLATQENARRNELETNRIATFLPTDYPARTYPDMPADVVIANILAGPLMELAPRLTQLTKPGGKLCLSGILDNQADAVMGVYRAYFVFEPIRTIDQWAQLAAIRRD